jgi:hypothetical protein
MELDGATLSLRPKDPKSRDQRDHRLKLESGSHQHSGRERWLAIPLTVSMSSQKSNFGFY